MKYNIVIKDFKEIDLLYYRNIISTYNDMGILWNKLESFAISMDIKPTNPCYSLAIFHDKGYKENKVDISVCISVAEKSKDNSEVKFRTFSKTTAATITFKGPHHQISNASKYLRMWISKNGHKLSGPNFIIYHVSPYHTNNPDEYVTEVCFPIEK